jgi:hypothetical protein
VDGLLGKDEGELLSPYKVLEAERAHHLVYLCLVHVTEEITVLPQHRLGKQDIAHEQKSGYEEQPCKVRMF